MVVKKIGTLVGCACVGGVITYAYAKYGLPALVAPDPVPSLTLPRSLDEAKEVHRAGAAFVEAHTCAAASLYLLLYLYLQTFSIPGSIFLSLLGGALFGTSLGFVLVTLAATGGACAAYGLSHAWLGSLISSLAPHRIAQLDALVSEHAQHGLNYMLFLRLTPLVPNWVINAGAPLCSDLPFTSYALGTAFGMMPASLVYVRAGMELQELSSTSDAVPLSALAVLSSLGILSLLPALFPNAVQSLLVGGTDTKPKQS